MHFHNNKKLFLSPLLRVQYLSFRGSQCHDRRVLTAPMSSCSSHFWGSSEKIKVIG